MKFQAFIKAEVKMMEQFNTRSYIPIMVEVNSLQWIIIGGGAVATRKVNMLLKQGALQITVVAPQLSQELKEKEQAGSIKVIHEHYKLNHLQGKHIVYAATDDIALNRTICRDAKLLNILVCNVSEQEQGNYITPSFFQKDELLFAVSSQGKSPLLSKTLAKQWEDYVDERLISQLPLLEQLRDDLKRDIEKPELRQQILREATPQILKEQVTDYALWYRSLLKHNC